MEELLEKTSENKPERDELGRLLPGNTANPNGRPKGSGMSLKEYMKRRLADMSEEEKQDFLRRTSHEMQWRMAEGNPAQDTNLGGIVTVKNFNITDGSEASIVPTPQETTGSSEGQPQI